MTANSAHVTKFLRLSQLSISHFRWRQQVHRRYTTPHSNQWQAKFIVTKVSDFTLN